MGKIHPEVIVVDSITKLPAQTQGRVAFCASHGGEYPALLALQAGMRAVVLNDAGVGLNQAGIRSLHILNDAGMPAATVCHRSARIGDAQHGIEHGSLSYVNQKAAALGLTPGQPISKAFELLHAHAPAFSPSTSVNLSHEHREVVMLDATTPVVLIDSVSLVMPEDVGALVVTGSHGGLFGSDTHRAFQPAVRAILFNDANCGIDDAGVSRLPALDEQGIPSACVSAWTAEIGNGRSAWNAGIVSTVNRCARQAGVETGISVQEFMRRVSHTSFK